MRTRTKVLITIGLAVLYFWASQHFGVSHKTATDPMTDTTLRQFYADSNEDYFLGQLPKNAHVSFGDLSVLDDMGLTFKRADGSFEIIIDRKTNPILRQAKLTLIHEQCHIATWQEELDSHGRKFQECMVDKAVHGAFHDLW